MQEQDDIDSTERCSYNLSSLVKSIMVHIHVYIHYVLLMTRKIGNKEERFYIFTESISFLSKLIDMWGALEPANG